MSKTFLVLEVRDQEVRAPAEFSIDRQRWGIAYAGMADDLIADQVVIRFDIRAPLPTIETHR